MRVNKRRPEQVLAQVHASARGNDQILSTTTEGNISHLRCEPAGSCATYEASSSFRIIFPVGSIWPPFCVA